LNLKKTRSISICTMLALGLLGACAGKPASQGATAVPGAANQPVASHAVPTGGPGGGPTAEGTVLETMDAAQYTYVRVKTASGEIWAATSTFKVAVGDQVVVPLDGAMQNFHSPTLKRDFPVIYFAPAITHVGEPAPGSLPPGHAPVGAAKPDLSVTQPIPPPAGGMTVADLWTNRKTLAGKTVTVRGKVVKFNGGILNLNWTHLQDGSGVEKDGTNDITITSAAEARLGDVITVTGTVVLDKDFGAGYAYKVMLQNATIAVK
jgi:hypothetical protein